MLASTVTDVVVSVQSSIVVGVIALAVALSRTRERVVRLEEWVRRYEKEESDES